jgi:hypothetical protein
LAYCLAGGLASASNVFVFQLFASVPAETLAYWALILVAVVAFLSGVLFAGVLARGLVGTLRRAGVIKDSPVVPMGHKAYPIFLVVVALLSVALFFFLRQALSGPATVHVGGAVENAYEYPLEHGDIPEVTAEGTLQQVTATYEGVPLREVIARAQPGTGASLVLVEASDGYAFFISMEEVQENENLLLAAQGEGEDASYNVVGAQNSKAWVRGVTELTVIGSATLEVGGALEQARPYDPNEWQFEMDSTRLDLGQGPAKYQGAPLGAVLESMNPEAGAATVVVQASDEAVSLPLSEVLEDDDLRILTIIGDDDVTFALARMSGEVIAYPVTSIEVR